MDTFLRIVFLYILVAVGSFSYDLYNGINPFTKYSRSKEMKSYVLKPVVIKAVQAENESQLRNELGSSFTVTTISEGVFDVSTSEGSWRISTGEWLVQDFKSTSVMQNDVFTHFYQEQ